MTEGATTSYQVKLDTVPNAMVRVKLTVPTDGGVSVGGSDLNSDNQLTFNTTNWSTFQTVTVTADQDDDAFNNSGAITHTVTGYPGVTTASDVTFNVNDDETAGVLIIGAMDEGGGAYSTSVTEATTKTYQLKLASKPYPDRRHGDGCDRWNNQGRTFRLQLPCRRVTRLTKTTGTRSKKSY